MKTHTFKTKIQGGSLLEVLIAILVLSIGMLAIAGSLLVSLQHSQNSMKHSQAIVQASSMIDTLRNHKSQAIIGQYNLTDWTCSSPSDDNEIGKIQKNWIEDLHKEIGPSTCGKIICTSLSCKVEIRWPSHFSVDNQNSSDNFDKYSIDTRI